MSEEENKQQKAEQSKQAQPQATTPAPKKSNKTLFIVLGVLAALFACGVIVVGAGIFTGGRAAKSKAKVGEDAEKPDNWPKDFPIYEGTLGYSVSGDTLSTVALTTGDKASTILGYYKKNMEAEGWKEKSKKNESGKVTITYEKESEKRTAGIIVDKDSEDKDKNSVMLMAISH